MMATDCSLKWREWAEKERVWVIEPGHPIAKGLGQYFEIPHTEMYGERFLIPTPDKVVFISWYPGGEVFRSGVTKAWQRGKWQANRAIPLRPIAVRLGFIDIHRKELPAACIRLHNQLEGVEELLVKILVVLRMWMTADIVADIHYARGVVAKEQVHRQVAHSLCP